MNLKHQNVMQLFYFGLICSKVKQHFFSKHSRSRLNQSTQLGSTKQQSETSRKRSLQSDLCYKNSRVIQKNNMGADSDTSRNERQENDEGNEYHVVMAEVVENIKVNLSLSH